MSHCLRAYFSNSVKTSFIYRRSCTLWVRRGMSIASFARRVGILFAMECFIWKTTNHIAFQVRAKIQLPILAIHFYDYVYTYYTLVSYILLEKTNLINIMILLALTLNLFALVFGFKI